MRLLWIVILAALLTGCATQQQPAGMPQVKYSSTKN